MAAHHYDRCCGAEACWGGGPSHWHVGDDGQDLVQGGVHRLGRVGGLPGPMVGCRHQGQLCPPGGHRPCFDGRDVAVDGVPHGDPAAGHPEVLRQHWVPSAAPSGAPPALPCG
eukprot:7158638-Pyramimonas_sp.AAC.1